MEDVWVCWTSFLFLRKTSGPSLSISPHKQAGLQTFLKKVTPDLIFPTSCPLTSPEAMPVQIDQGFTLEVPLSVPSVTHGTCYMTNREAQETICRCTFRMNVNQEHSDSNALISWEMKISPTKTFSWHGHVFMKHRNEKQRFKEWHVGFGQGWARHAHLEDWENHADHIQFPTYYTLLSCFSQIIEFLSVSSSWGS